MGPSGKGGYHGCAGFRTFSHQKSVFRQARLNTAGLLRPSYGKLIERLITALMH